MFRRIAFQTAVASVLLCCAQSAFAASGISVVGARHRYSSGATVSLPILMYHYIEPYGDPKDQLRRRLTVLPETLEQELQMIREKNVPTLTMHDVPQYLDGRPHTLSGIVLTFDDGYEDFYTYAFPLLKKYHMKATFYVISGSVGKSGYVTLPQLQEMAWNGLVEIGAHTVTHPDLRRLSAQRAWKEIAGSKQALEDMIGMPVTTFAYPSGRYTAQTVEAVRKIGFISAVGTREGIEHRAGDLFTLKRVRPGGWKGKGFLRLLERH